MNKILLTIVLGTLLFAGMASAQITGMSGPTVGGLGGKTHLTKIDFLQNKTFIDADADTWCVFLGGAVDSIRFWLYGAVAQADSDSICLKVKIAAAPYGTGPYMTISGDSTSLATATTASGTGLYKLNSGTTAYAQSWMQGVIGVEWLRVILVGTATTNTRPVVKFFGAVPTEKRILIGGK